MRSVLLQDTVTIRGSGTTAAVQDAKAWLDAPGFADAVFWIEVKEVTNPGAGSVSLAFETAPAELESLFVAVDSVSAVGVTTTPLIRKVFMNATPGVPLARFLRWKLVGSAAGTWDVTFRVFVTLGAGNRNAFSPLQLPNLALWLRADQGITLSGTKVSQWNDLSGNTNSFVFQSVDASRPILTPNAIGGRPALNFATTAFLENTIDSTNLGISAGSAYSVLVVAKNGSGALFALRRTNAYSASIFFQNATYIFSDGINPQGNMTVSNTLPETQSATNAFKSCHRFNGVNTWADIFINGTNRPITSAVPSPPTGTYQTSETGSAGFYVGWDTASQAWGGLIAEIIVTRNAISDANRVRVESYQRDYFGI